MEQGNRLDSTLVSARHEADGRLNDEPALDTAISSLLMRPVDGTHATQSDAALALRSENTDMASACIEQVARLNHWDANPESLTGQEGDAEMERWNAVFRRAIDTPSADLRDLASKAHLMLADLNRFHPAERNPSDDHRLMRVILAEVMGFGGLSDAKSDEVGTRRDAPKADPILAMINEGRWLLHDYIKAYRIFPQDPATIDPRPEWEAARRPLRDLIDHAVLVTVPRTAEGCRELARFAEEYLEAMDGPISDDETVVLHQIARSPLLNGAEVSSRATLTSAQAKASAERVDLWDLSVDDLCAFYKKLGGARELWCGALSEPRAIASTHPDSYVFLTPYGDRADAEDQRAGFLRDRIASEASRRMGADNQERDDLLAIRIEHEIECEGRIKDPGLLADITLAWG